VSFNPVQVPGQRCAGDPLSGSYSVVVYERIGAAWTRTLGIVRGCCGSRMALDAGTLAVTRRTTGVDVYRRIAPGTWSASDFLEELGTVGILDPEAPRLLPVTLSGDTVVLGSVRGTFETESFLRGTGSLFAFSGTAEVHTRDASGTWSAADTLLTDQYYLSNGFQRPGIEVSLQGDNLAIGGQLFRRNRYGDWSQMADLTATAGSLALSSSDIAYTLNGTVDAYRADAQGFWQPAVRLQQPADPVLGVSYVQGDRYALGSSGAIHIYKVPAHPVASRTFGAFVHPDAVVAGQAVQVVVNAASVDSRIATVRNIAYQFDGGPWLPMTPGDGAFDGGFETGIVQLQAGTAGVTTPGLKQVCVRVTDSAGRVSEQSPSLTAGCQTIEVLPPPSDVDRLAPDVSEVSLYASVIQLGQSNGVVAFADDGGRGDSGIWSLEWSFGNFGPWHPMQPVDGLFDGQRFPTRGAEPFESATAYLPPAARSGNEVVCVRAIDMAGNVSAPNCVLMQVLPN